MPTAMSHDTPRPSAASRGTVDTAAVQALETALRTHIAGQVDFSTGARALYATDASNYRQVPVGVVFPRTTDDVIEIVRCSRDYGVALLPRGAGTSLAGQCCNVALIIDTSRHLRDIISIDPERKIARVAALRCVGVGKCRKTHEGTMCPSYMVTRDERHSTRGRAHLLFEMLRGETITSGWESDEVKSALDLCLRGVQVRMPGQRRHGDLQGGVSRALLRPAPASSPRSPVRAYRLVGDGGSAGAAAGERTRVRPPDRPPVSICCRSRTGAAASAVRHRDLPTLDGSPPAAAGRDASHRVVGYVHEQGR
jgi:hypothetical protein